MTHIIGCDLARCYFFAEFGREIDKRWRARNYDERAFPDIAATMLSDRSPIDYVGPDDITKWILSTDVQVAQNPSEFGDPPIALYHDSRVHIQALIWVDGTTSIHQHAFSGAFQVFAGSSIHSRWRFEETARISSSLLLGKMERIAVDALRQRDITPISAGAGFIHSLFHLDRPSISVVVRTGHEKQHDPQYVYLPPHIAEDRFTVNSLVETRLRCLASMEKFDPHYDQALERFIDQHDFKSVFAALRQDYLSRNSDERLAGLIGRMRERYAELVDLVVPVLKEEARRHNIIGRREQVSNEEHRYFLALLLNLQNQDEILQLVGARFPGDPKHTVMRWAKELSVTRPNGTFALLDLEIEPDGRHLDFSVAGMVHAVFGALLHRASFEQVMASLREEFGARCVEGEKESIHGLYEALKNSSVFHPLFR